MALAIADRIKELSDTVGSGPFHMNGATPGYKAVASALANGDQAYFGAFDGAGTWVIFLGTYTSAGNTVTVNTVLSSSPGYAGFATAPTVWIDSPAALLAKILPVMPANDDVVGRALTQTLSNKTVSDQLVIGGVAANVFANPGGVLLTRAGNTTDEWGVGDSSTYTQNVNGSQYTSFYSRPQINGGPVGNVIGFEHLPRINLSSGNVINLYQLYLGFGVTNSGATLSNRTAIMIVDDPGSTGTVTSQYGIMINPLTRGTAGNNWAIYVSPPTRSYFGGNLAIGDDTTYFGAGGLLNMSLSTNAAASLWLRNNNAGGGAYTQLVLTNGSYNMMVGLTGTGFTPSGQNVPNLGIVNSGGAPGGLLIATGAAAPILFAPNGNNMIQLNSAGHLLMASAGYPFTDTGGMICIGPSGGAMAAANYYCIRAGGGNGFVIISDNYDVNKSLFNMGIQYSSADGILGFCVKPGSSSNILASSLNQSAGRCSINFLYSYGYIQFYTGAVQNVALGSACTMVLAGQCDSNGNWNFLSGASGGSNATIWASNPSGKAYYTLRIDQGQAAQGVAAWFIATAGLGYQIFFQNSNGTVGAISTNGSATTYATSSDLNLKKNIKRHTTDPGQIIDAIEVDEFDWKIDDRHVPFGIVAQKLEKICPASVTPPGKNTQSEWPWMIDHSSLVPLLLAEIQSLRQRMAKQETRH